MPHENKFKNEKVTTPYTNAENPVIFSRYNGERCMDRVVSVNLTFMVT